jgi:thymidylate synthase
LAHHSKSSVRTVASTIFPTSLWRRDKPPSDLYERYERLWPRIKRVRANVHGTYFRRFYCFGPETAPVNQIQHILDTWGQGNHRRSALQLAVFDPTRDHTHQRQRGFPCLHQVALVHDGPTLRLTAFYAMQVILEKAYGNYLGLTHLGQFLAHAMHLTLTEVTCVAAVAKLTQIPDVLKPQRMSLSTELRAAIGAAV